MMKLKRNSTIAGLILIAGPILAALDILLSGKSYEISVASLVTLQLVVSALFLYSSRQLHEEDKSAIGMFVFSCYVVISYFLIFCSVMIFRNVDALGFNLVSIISTVVVFLLILYPFIRFVNQARGGLPAEKV